MVLRLHRYLVVYNFFIALCAVCFLYYFSLIFQKSIPSPVYVFTFSSTLFVYNLFRHYQSIGDFVRAFKTPLHSITLYALVISLACFTLFSTHLKLVYAAIGLLTLCYKFPLTGSSSLRVLPYLKIVVISLVWVLSGMACFVGPADIHPAYGVMLVYLLMQLLFFMSICIPFDIFDSQRDTMLTIPRRFGARSAMLIAYSGMALYMLLAFLLPCSRAEKVGYVAMTVCVSVVLWYSGHIKRKFMHYYLIDGLIILQTGIVFLCRYDV